MALYELYLGGARQQNPDFAMFPAAPFNVANPAEPATGQQLVTYAPSRYLDFTGFDQALALFLANNPLASGDEIGTQILPGKSMLLGFWWEVSAIVPGLTFTVLLREAALTLLTAQSAGVLSSGFVLVETAGAFLPVYFPTPDIFDVVFPAVPVAGVAGLGLTVTPVYWNFRSPADA